LHKWAKLAFINDALDIAKFNRDCDENDFMRRLRVAVVKALIFAGYTLCSTLMSMGGFSMMIPQLGELLLQNPKASFLGSAVVFSSAFFGKLMLELKISKETA